MVARLHGWIRYFYRRIDAQSYWNVIDFNFLPVNNIRGELFMKLGRRTAGRRKRSNKVASFLLASLFFSPRLFCPSLVFFNRIEFIRRCINSYTNVSEVEEGEGRKKEEFFSHCKSVICFVPLLFFLFLSLSKQIQSLLNHVTNSFDEI